ncbi:sugar phosphate isomerase/epimerase family protein [Salipiger abyssi]|uniref:sugar phosphate isomerase/epimerase family protein n=1 Tax=Salipiger abyssi TaxID=1250539 RepID=UPI0040595135
MARTGEVRRRAGYDLTLWPACVRGYPLREQIAAASAAGYSCIAVNSATYVAALSEGLSGAEIAEIVKDHGLRVSWVDAVTGWLPVRYPPRAPELRDFLDHDLDIAFEMAETLGATSLLAVGSFDHATIPMQELVDRFGSLCDRAARRGLRVGLEFIPFWGIATLRTALDIVAAAGASNGGFVLDSWHFYRGDPDLALIGEIPAGKLYAVQLADAALRIRGVNLLDDCLQYRCAPGQGALPLDDFMASVTRLGASDFGPEIFSSALDTLPAQQAAELCADATRALLKKHHIAA